ncbi:hypothetical protein R83H12_02509 [Fibrobacteria bacterium R8-3-H12]
MNHIYWLILKILASKLTNALLRYNFVIIAIFRSCIVGLAAAEIVNIRAFTK